MEIEGYRGDRLPGLFPKKGENGGSYSDALFTKICSLTRIIEFCPWKQFW